MRQLAGDNQVSVSPGYDCLHEGIDVLADCSPSLHGALLAAKAAGYDYVIIDGTPIETDRCRTAGPAEGVDPWWSGKHDHGGNIQVISVPDGWPVWTSSVRPGREHDTTAAIGERGNSLLKMASRALRNISLNPWRLGRPSPPRWPSPHRARPHHMTTFSSQSVARNGRRSPAAYRPDLHEAQGRAVDERWVSSSSTGNRSTATAGHLHDLTCAPELAVSAALKRAATELNPPAPAGTGYDDAVTAPNPDQATRRTANPSPSRTAPPDRLPRGLRRPGEPFAGSACTNVACRNGSRITGQKIGPSG
jgi:hypothetical protein